MLMSYLSGEERKAYKQGDYVGYTKEQTLNEPEQERLKRQYEKEQKLSYAPYMPVLKKRCPYCGDVFYTDSVRLVYCSARCQNDAYMARRAERKKKSHEKVCPVCGQEFQAKSAKARYCSDACRQKHYRQNRNEA